MAVIGVDIDEAQCFLKLDSVISGNGAFPEDEIQCLHRIEHGDMQPSSGPLDMRHASHFSGDMANEERIVSNIVRESPSSENRNSVYQWTYLPLNSRQKTVFGIHSCT